MRAKFECRSVLVGRLVVKRKCGRQTAFSLSLLIIDKETPCGPVAVLLIGLENLSFESTDLD